MDPFVRLRQGDASEDERRLLDSAGEDQPSVAARNRTLAALGLSAGLGTMAASHTAAAAAKLAPAGGAAGAAGMGKSAGGASLLALLKWFGAGGVLAAVTVGGVATVTSLHTDAPKSAAVPVATARTQLPAAPLRAGRDPATPEAAPVIVSADGGVAVPGRSAVARPEKTEAATTPLEIAPPPAVEPPSNAGAVVAEVASLDRARSALSAGDPRGALTALAEHERRFPSGALEPEAVVLRVRATRDLGSRATAIAIANQFLSEHPSSPQGPRLRALIDSMR